MKMKQKKITRHLKTIIHSNWTITIIATMIGMSSGIYLNGYLRDREVNAKYKIAIEKIKQELKSNVEIISESNEFHNRLYQAFKFIYENTNNEGSLVVSSIVMHDFRTKYPQAISLLDSTRLEDDMYLYKGQLDIELSSMPSIEVSDIAWQLFKDTDFKYKIDYECLYTLTVGYNLQYSVGKENGVFLNYLNGQLDKGEKGIKFLTHFELLLQYEKALLEYYESIGEMDCS